MNKEKRCPKCGIIKFLNKFHRDKTKAGGFRSYCKECVGKYTKDRYAANLVSGRKYARDWYKGNRFKASLYNSRNNAKRLGYVPCNATEGEIEAAFTGHCFVCGIPEIECNGKLHLDHCHKMGKFRGWLCRGCNQASGLLKESPQIARILAEYIEHHEKKSLLIKE